MNRIASLAAFAAGAVLPTPAAAQAPPCAEALRADQPEAWETAELITADLTLDGVADAAYWRADGSQVVLLIGTCDDADVAQHWRFAFDLPGDCPPTEARVEVISLLVDPALVDRTCTGDRSASECAHLRRENQRRQALMDAGGRALRIGGPSCAAATLRWSPEFGGFLRFPG
mgnify:CR=1 FL=1